jgi:diaminopropionate ammonia-lyase
VCRAVIQGLGLDARSSLGQNGQFLDFRLLGVVARDQELGVNLVTCSEGNWEQAVARMARYMGIPIVVHVPLEYVRDDE